MAFTFHGIGTKTYGERDHWPDGSFVTTEWFVVAYLPISPSVSMRVSHTQPGPFAKLDREGYYIHKTVPANRKQVVSTYLWFASVIATIVLWAEFQNVLEKYVGDADNAAGLWLMLMAILLALPFTLRWLAKRRKMQKWKRMNAGLESPSDEE
jgi:hypothetical protein